MPGLTSLLRRFSRAGLFAGVMGCGIIGAGAYATTPISIIPKPVSLKRGTGTFHLTKDTVIRADAAAKNEADLLAQALEPATGFATPVQTPSSGDEKNAIILKLDSSLASLGAEGYHLDVTPDTVKATAPTTAGLFYATETFRQLLPVDIFSSIAVKGKDWTAPAVSIEDQPRFLWRGHLLDVGRHFFTVDEVKRDLDLMALHKLNRFHWHLTEDQGWRIEVKKYPNLTKIGAWRTEEDGTRYGGFYTQDQIREVVAYAAARHITVIPEIEMPGHSDAALASYPWLGCTGGPYTVGNHWGVYKEVYCAGKDTTFDFIENVLDEVLPLFPSQYVHIGGDECPKDRWASCPLCQARIRKEGLKDEKELQSWFIQKISKHLEKHGKHLIGWDEILQGGLAPGAMVQSWHGAKGGIEAANAGHNVIMSPTAYCYLDYSYERTPLKKVYSYQPVPAKIDPDKVHYVLGIEGNSWAERIPTQARYEFQTYPRLTALAEVAWTPKEERSWSDFQKRMKAQRARFHEMGVQYGRPEKKDAAEKGTKK